MSVALIDEDPDNPRTEFPEAELDELADDIHQRGPLQPLVVNAKDADGHRRVAAGESHTAIARQLGIDLSAVAHHLALLASPPVLDKAKALQAGPRHALDRV